MHDFDATNLLSDEKHSDYGDPFDKTKYHKAEFKNIGKKEEKTDNDFVSTEHEQIHDKPRAPASNGKHFESNQNSKNVDGERSKETKIVKHYSDSTSKQDDKATVSKTPEKATQTLFRKTTLKRNVLKETILLKTIGSTTAAINRSTKTNVSPSGYNGKEIKPISGTKINKSLKFDDKNTDEKAPKEILQRGYANNVDSINVLTGESTTKGTPPYLTVLTSSVAVLAVVLIILFAILLYRRRSKNTPVISDEMYNAYKLSKKMKSRSPLPSPRGSEQSGNSEYDFITGESVSAQITSETTVKHVKEPEESVYLELDDDLRYDYVTALVNPD